MTAACGEARTVVLLSIPPTELAIVFAADGS